jgi:hypothetical protein
MERIALRLPTARDGADHRGARRTAPRFPLHSDVEVTAAQGRNDAVALNVSAGGMRLAIDATAVPDGYVTVAFEAEGMRFRERGRIVWARLTRDGVIAGLAFEPE